MIALAAARRAALVQFAVSSAVLLAVVATIGAVLLKRVATGEALQDERAVTAAYGEGVLREHITPAVLNGDPHALRELDGAVRERVLGRPIVRVKVWSPAGRIVYSDAASLIGRRVPLPAHLPEALDDDGVRADVSDLSRPENRFERGHGRLVEVYLPLRLADGGRVIVEAYHPAGSIHPPPRGGRTRPRAQPHLAHDPPGARRAADRARRRAAAARLVPHPSRARQGGR